MFSPGVNDKGVAELIRLRAPRKIRSKRHVGSVLNIRHSRHGWTATANSEHERPGVSMIGNVFSPGDGTTVAGGFIPSDDSFKLQASLLDAILPDVEFRGMNPAAALTASLRDIKSMALGMLAHNHNRQSRHGQTKKPKHEVLRHSCFGLL